MAFIIKMAGIIRIEQILNVLETFVLPLHQIPKNKMAGATRLERVPAALETADKVLKTRMLPLHQAPIWRCDCDLNTGK